jgi:ABC-type microcin C transport system duplicated ATPase subunit YejF
MRDGVVVERGNSESIFEAPEMPYTRALIKAAFELKSTGEVSGG